MVICSDNLMYASLQTCSLAVLSHSSRVCVCAVTSSSGHIFVQHTERRLPISLKDFDRVTRSSLNVINDKFLFFSFEMIWSNLNLITELSQWAKPKTGFSVCLWSDILVHVWRLSNCSLFYNGITLIMFRLRIWPNLLWLTRTTNVVSPYFVVFLDRIKYKVKMTTRNKWIACTHDMLRYESLSSLRRHSRPVRRIRCGRTGSPIKFRPVIHIHIHLTSVCVRLEQSEVRSFCKRNFHSECEIQTTQVIHPNKIENFYSIPMSIHIRTAHTIHCIWIYL